MSVDYKKVFRYIYSQPDSSLVLGLLCLYRPKYLPFSKCWILYHFSRTIHGESSFPCKMDRSQGIRIDVFHCCVHCAALPRALVCVGACTASMASAHSAIRRRARACGKAQYILHRAFPFSGNEQSNGQSLKFLVKAAISVHIHLHQKFLIT